MNNLRGDFLAISAVGLLGWTLYALFNIDFPDSSKDVLLVVIGALISIVKDVYGFEYGGSKGGERNAQVIRDMSKDATAAAAVAASTPLKADDVNVQAAGDVTITGDKK